MLNGINTNTFGGRPFVCQTRTNVTSDESGLSEREREILAQIRNKVGGPVELNLGQQSGGFTVALLGFGGASWCGTRQPFLITKCILAEMADSPQKFTEHMSWIGQQIQQQFEMETSFRDAMDRVKAEENERQAERKSHQIRLNMLSVLDFWNDNVNAGNSWTQPTQGQAIERITGLYEQNLSVQ